MARGRKNYTLDEQIENISKRIIELRTELDRLETEKDVLIEEKNQRDMKELYEIIQQSGHTIDDVKELLNIKN